MCIPHGWWYSLAGWLAMYIPHGWCVGTEISRCMTTFCLHAPCCESWVACVAGCYFQESRGNSYGSYGLQLRRCVSYLLRWVYLCSQRIHLNRDHNVEDVSKRFRGVPNLQNRNLKSKLKWFRPACPFFSLDNGFILYMYVTAVSNVWCFHTKRLVLANNSCLFSKPILLFRVENRLPKNLTTWRQIFFFASALASCGAISSSVVVASINNGYNHPRKAFPKMGLPPSHCFLIVILGGNVSV